MNKKDTDLIKNVYCALTEDDLLLGDFVVIEGDTCRKVTHEDDMVVLNDSFSSMGSYKKGELADLAGQDTVYEIQLI